MSQPNVKFVSGCVLVGVGILFVAASIAEQPAPVKTAANRFYSKSEAEQYQKDVVFLQVRAFSALGTVMSEESDLSPLIAAQNALAAAVPVEAVVAETDTVDAHSEIDQDVSEIADRVVAARKLQAAAFVKQKWLSQGLQASGVVALVIGAVVLLVARRAYRIARTSRDAAELIH